MNGIPNTLIQQIVSSYESAPGGAVVVAALGEAFDLDPVLVGEILHNYSALYRRTQKGLDGGTGNDAPQPDITDEERREFQEGLKHLARTSQDERLRFKALARLVDDQRGRLDKVTLAPVSNILIINERLRELKEARRARAIEAAVVDVAEIPEQLSAQNA